jgi:hypothetical protein
VADNVPVEDAATTTGASAVGRKLNAAPAPCTVTFTVGLKFEPVTVTGVAGPPDAGDNEIDGAARTTMGVSENFPLALVVSEILIVRTPVVRPAGARTVPVKIPEPSVDNVVDITVASQAAPKLLQYSAVKSVDAWLAVQTVPVSATMTGVNVGGPPAPGRT